MTCCSFKGLHPATRGRENPMHASVFVSMTNGDLSVLRTLYLVMAFQRPTGANGGNKDVSSTFLASFSLKILISRNVFGLLVVSRRGIVFQTSLAPQEGQFYRTFFSETISCLLSECQVCICQNAHWQAALWLRELFWVHNKVAVIWKTQRLSFSGTQEVARQFLAAFLSRQGLSSPLLHIIHTMQTDLECVFKKMLESELISGCGW